MCLVLHVFLGVKRESTTAEIQKAYRTLSLRYHPDKYKGTRKEDATRAFQTIADAVETLRDPSSRSSYDRTLRESSGSSAQFTGSSSSSSSQSSAPRSTYPAPPPHVFDQAFDTATLLAQAKRVFHGMYVFMTEVASALRGNSEADVSFAYPSFLLAASHISTDVLTFLLREQPTLLMMLGMAGLGYFMFTDEATRTSHFQNLDWNSMPPSIKLQVVDGLVLYYKSKLRAATR